MKKFIISSDVLKPVLKKLGIAVDPKTLTPAHSNIYCKVSSGQVELTTTNMDLIISVKCVAEAKEEFEMLLPYDFTSGIMGQVGSTPVTIEHPSARKAKILCDGDVFEINSLGKLEEFSKIPAIPKKGKFKVSSEFVSILSRCIATVGKDNLRPAMTKACLDLRKKEAFLVSTDAHAMFRYKMDVQTEEPIQLLIAASTASALDGMQELEISWTDKKVVFIGENLCVWAHLYDEKFPNYESIIPKTPANLSIERTPLLAALNKACLIKTSDRRVNVLLKKETGKICLDADDADSARAVHASVSGEYTGDIESFSVNAKKMITVLNQVEQEKISLHIQSANKAILISTDEDANHLGLLMPIMTN